MALKNFKFKNTENSYVAEPTFSIIAKDYNEAEKRLKALKITCYQLIDVSDHDKVRADFVKRGRTEYMPQNGHYLDYSLTVIQSYK